LQNLKNIKDPQESLKMVDILRKFLLEEYHGSLSQEQIQRLEKGIGERLAGSMNDLQFSELLDKSVSEGGIGLNTLTAEHLSERLEIILAQAYESN